MLKRLIVVLALVLSGCASAGDSNPLIHRHEDKVGRKLHGEIKIGMTEAEVRQTWGEPDRIISKSVRGSDHVWVYKPHWKFENLLYFKDGVLIGGEPNPENLF